MKTPGYDDMLFSLFLIIFPYGGDSLVLIEVSYQKLFGLIQKMMVKKLIFHIFLNKFCQENEINL